MNAFPSEHFMFPFPSEHLNFFENTLKFIFSFNTFIIPLYRSNQ